MGLSGRVDFVTGDVTELPFADGGFDACLSQESLLHVAAKERLFAECRRVLRAGGRLAFSDWAAQPTLTAAELGRLAHAFSAPGIAGVAGYVEQIHRAGFTAVETDDLSDAWRQVLPARLERYRGMRDAVVARLGEEHYESWEREYAFMVALVEAGKLGGARFVATAR